RWRGQRPAIQKPIRNRERISLRMNNIAGQSRLAHIRAIGCRGRRKGSFSEATKNSRPKPQAEKVQSYRRWREAKNVSRLRSAREEQIPQGNKAATEMKQRCRRKTRDETKSRTSRYCIKP